MMTGDEEVEIPDEIPVDGDVHMTPLDLITGKVADEKKREVSPEVEDLLQRYRAKIRAEGKASAAAQYTRHLRNFFAWTEGQGLTLRNLPKDIVENYVASLELAGQKPGAVYMMRNMLRMSLRRLHDDFQIPLGHLEFQPRRNKGDRAVEIANRKERARQKREQLTAAQQAAVDLARAAGFPVVAAPYSPPTHALAGQSTEDANPESTEITMPSPASPTDQPTPQPNGVSTQAAPPPNVIVVQSPQQAAPRQPPAQKPPVGLHPAGTVSAGTGKGLTINTQTFNGHYVRINRMSDGSDPFVSPGTEVYVQTLPLSSLATHGDPAQYLQTFVVPNLKLPANVGQAQFVFHELNDRRQPTGRKDELTISVNTQAAPTALNGVPGAPHVTIHNPPVETPMADAQMKRLDADIEAARRRADELEKKLESEKDSKTTFMLLQQQTQIQALMHDLERERAALRDRDQQARLMAMAPAPAPIPALPEPPRVDPMVEMMKASLDAQSRLLETLIRTQMQAPPPPPPPQPQKDVAEWLVPFMAQQQQNSQQMLVGIMQANQQFMQAMLTKDSPVEKLLMAQLQEAKAQASAPKGDDMEDFVMKLQKAKVVTEMLGGGGGGNSIIGDLLANADAIGEGAAKIIAATKSDTAPKTAPALNGVPPAGALPPAAPPTPPAKVVADLDTAAKAALAGDDQVAVTSVINILNTLITSGPPFDGMGRRLMAGLRDMDDETELYTFAKSLYMVAQKNPDRKAVKAISGVLAKWYSVIHETLFQIPKSIGDQPEPQMTDAGDEGEEYEDEEGDEIEAEGDTQPEPAKTANTVGQYEVAIPMRPAPAAAPAAAPATVTTDPRRGVTALLGG